MAETAHTTAKADWNTAVACRADIINSLDENSSHDQGLDERLAAVENHLLGLAAPDLAGVTLKLELLWEGQLHGHDRDSEHKLAVLADLRRLAA
jgi:hypothetical protein